MKSTLAAPLSDNTYERLHESTWNRDTPRRLGASYRTDVWNGDTVFTRNVWELGDGFPFCAQRHSGPVHGRA